MHTEGYCSCCLCIYCRPMVESDGVMGMQCIQEAIVAVALYMHCRPMVEIDSVTGMQCIQRSMYL